MDHGARLFDDIGLNDLLLRFVFVPDGEPEPEHLLADFSEIVRIPAIFVPEPEPLPPATTQAIASGGELDGTDALTIPQANIAAHAVVASELWGGSSAPSEKQREYSPPPPHLGRETPQSRGVLFGRAGI